MARGLENIDRIVARGVGLARRSRGVSQAELSRAIGIKAEEVADLESGVAHPTPAQLTEIAKFLGVGVAFFFTHDQSEASTRDDAPTADEGLRLLRAFHRIPNSAMRQKIIAYAETFADQG